MDCVLDELMEKQSALLSYCVMTYHQSRFTAAWHHYSKTVEFDWKDSTPLIQKLLHHLIVWCLYTGIQQVYWDDT